MPCGRGVPQRTFTGTFAGIFYKQDLKKGALALSCPTLASAYLIPVLSSRGYLADKEYRQWATQQQDTAHHAEGHDDTAQICEGREDGEQVQS